MKKNICIVHYNTPYMTECLIKSINKYVGYNCHIYIFDNSDKEPFTYKQDNITLFDNTQGQIINFDEWLKNFPNKSVEATGTFASAKHSISIDKCMDLINDNFILMDSDILLKKDVSDLYNDNYIFIGEFEMNPMLKKEDVGRILPFICFINVKMCQEYNVRYFNENFMHGLNNSSIGDFYDTGGGLYINARNYSHKYINIGEYITHYKGGSWDYTHPSCKEIHGILTPFEWLNYNKEYWTNFKKNVCIVHYNTPYLTECLVKSINKHTPNCHIYIFDNSDKEPFTYKQDNLMVFDNTQGQIINFNKILEQYPNRYHDGISNYGSFKHCISIQKCIELIDDNFVLMDSDILIKKDFSNFYQEDKIFVGCFENQGNEWMNRVCPYLCFLNNNMCKEYNIHYYNDEYMVGLSEYQKNNMKYDTGAYFLEQTMNYEYLIIDIYEYMIHYHGASWKNNNVTLGNWLIQNKNLLDPEGCIITNIINYDDKGFNITRTNNLKVTKLFKKDTKSLSFKKEIKIRHEKLRNTKRRKH